MIMATKRASEVRLPQVKAPALVIMGTRDPDFKDPTAEAQFVAAQLHGDLRLVAGAGHYPHVELPADTNPAVVAFVQSVYAPVAHGA